MGSRFFPKTISAWNGLAFAEAPSLAVISQNFLTISVHNTLEGSCGMLNQNQSRFVKNRLVCAHH